MIDSSGQFQSPPGGWGKTEGDMWLLPDMAHKVSLGASKLSLGDLESSLCL